MFDDVGDVHPAGIDAHVLHRLPKQVARCADERPTASILHIARLFTDDHQLRITRPFPEDRLCGGLV